MNSRPWVARCEEKHISASHSGPQTSHILEPPIRCPSVAKNIICSCPSKCSAGSLTGNKVKWLPYDAQTSYCHRTNFILLESAVFTHHS
jgi:hypothetical protein